MFSNEYALTKLLRQRQAELASELENQRVVRQAADADDPPAHPQGRSVPSRLFGGASRDISARQNTTPEPTK